MTVVAPGQPAIPEPRGDDDEDVSWALSTAAALFARGDPQEGLKWLRRAAESASDANRDARSLELFKAAADLSNHLKVSGASGSTPPPSRVTPAPPAVGSSAPVNVSGRSNPPPPPRGRPTATGGSTMVMSQSAPTPRVDPMAALDAVAPTVPGPALPGRTTSHVTTGGTPFVPGPFQSSAPVSPQQLLLAQGVSRGTLVPGAKTLASNVTFDQLNTQRQGANGDPVRIEISKAATIPDAHARELANRAARQMHGAGQVGASARATHPGVGPGSADLATTAIQQPAQQQQLQREGAGVDARKITGPRSTATSSPLPVGSVKPPPPNPTATPAQPAQAVAQPHVRVAASAGRDMARQSNPSADSTGDNAITRVATTPPKHELRAMMPDAAPTVPGGLIDQRPASRGRRRSTMGGGRRASKSSADQRASEESGGKSAVISEARPPTARFEDEITIERDLSGVTTGLSASDLDENTNVLSGEELDDQTPSSTATPVAPEKPSAARNGGIAAASRNRRSLSRVEQGRRPTTRVEGSQRAGYPEHPELNRENTEAKTFSGLGDPRTSFESTTAENMSAAMAEAAAEIPPTEAFPMTGRSNPAPEVRKHAAPSSNADNLGLAAFRVAISLELVQGRLDVLPLAPGEPAPTGRFAAVIVASDVAASATLTEMVTRAMDGGDTVIHPLAGTSGADRRQRKS